MNASWMLTVFKNLSTSVVILLPLHTLSAWTAGVERVQSLTVGIAPSETLLWAAIMVGGWQQTEHEKDSTATTGIKVAVTIKDYGFSIFCFLFHV